MGAQKDKNSIPVLHRLVTDEYGENYWFNGCARYVMECLGEPDYDYWFFSGVTGDIFTQHYSFTSFSCDALSGYKMNEDPRAFVGETFAKCGYEAGFVSRKELEEATQTHLNALMAHIDKGVPVIAWGEFVGVYVGYEDYGKTLLYITGNSGEPIRISLEEALQKNDGWIFVGAKTGNPSLAETYRQAITDIPKHFSVRTNAYCFGPEAFRSWASEIDNGKFDGMAPEEFHVWEHYTDYVCVLATNGSCSYDFLARAKQLNPDFAWLDQVEELYRRTGRMWENDNGNDLEAIGGGFNITLETLQDKEKRERITKVIRKCGDCMDEVLNIINSNL